MSDGPDEIGVEQLPRSALAAAARPLIQALVADPLNEACLSALDELIARAESASDVAPLSANTNLEVAAAHARALWHEGRRADALILLIDVARCGPELPFLAWSDDWAVADLELSSDETSRLGAALSALASRIKLGADTMHERTRTSALRLLSLLAQRLPERSELSLFASLIARQVGDLSAGSYFAQKAFEASPSWLSAIHLAAALRQADDLESAAIWYRRAAELDPNEPSTYLDLGDVELELGHFAAAREAFQRGLVQGADQSWVEACLALCVKLETGSDGAQPSLRGLARAGNARAKHWCALLDEKPFERFIPRPWEPAARPVERAIDLLNASKASDDQPVVLRLHLPHTPAPSLCLAFAVALAQLGRQAELQIAVEAVARPDPRLPRAPVELSLWSYHESTPRVAIAPPSDAVRTRVVPLAARAYDLDEWWERAGAIAAELSEESWQEVAACMAHITLPPPGLDAIEWVWRTQLAAALVLSRLGTGWQGSVRRTALLSLLRGPLDWSTAAGVVALFALARRDPEARLEAQAVFRELALVAEGHSAPAHLYTLAVCWAELGADDALMRARLWGWRRQAERALGADVVRATPAG